MESVTRVQILDETGCISLCVNDLERGMNPSVLHSAMGKLLGRLGYLALVRQPGEEKENSEFKSAVIRLKNLTLCLILFMIEGL